MSENAASYWPANVWSVEVLSGPAPIPTGVPALISETARVMIGSGDPTSPTHGVTYQPVTLRVEPGEAWLMVIDPSAGSGLTFLSMHLTRFTVGDDEPGAIKLSGLVGQEGGTVSSGAWLARPYQPPHARPADIAGGKCGVPGYRNGWTCQKRLGHEGNHGVPTEDRQDWYDWP